MLYQKKKICILVIAWFKEVINACYSMKRRSILFSSPSNLTVPDNLSYFKKTIPKQPKNVNWLDIITDSFIQQIFLGCLLSVTGKSSE